MPVDVSVCIVSWNAARDLERCLQSLPHAARDLSIQTIVVDNGSADDTEAVLDRNPQVEKIVNTHNPGLTPGRNQATARARGRYILMLDADTAPREGSIATLAAYLDDHSQVGLVGAKLVHDDGSLQLSCRRLSPLALPFLRRPPLSRWFEHSKIVDRHLMRDYDHQHARPVEWVLGACQCYRAELVQQLGGYDERIFSHGGEDYDWCVRVWKGGFEVHYCPQAVVVHSYGHFTRKRPLSKQALRALTDYYYVAWKHRDARRGLAGQ